MPQLFIAPASAALSVKRTGRTWVTRVRALIVALVVGWTAQLGFSVETSAARGDSWKPIASEDIDLRVDRMSIDLKEAPGRYKALRLRVRGRTITFNSLKVTYADAPAFSVDRQFRLSNRERTKILDEREAGYFLETLELAFDPIEGSRKRTSRLEVWALQNRADRSAKRFSQKLADAADSVGQASQDVTLSDTPPLPSKVAPGATSPAGDVLFGAKYVGFGIDRDVIRVGRQLGKFRKLRLRVLDNDIYLNKLTVIYYNGRSQDIAVDTKIERNKKTQWFDLSGNERFIDSVELSYRSKPGFRGQARVEVFGEHVDGWLGKDGEGRKFNKGWVLLAAQTAGFIGFDKDVIPVGDNTGGFKEIRVDVRDRAITLNELRVIYAGGEKDIVPVKARVDAGASYGPIELRFADKMVDRIEASYRSRVIDRDATSRGSAIVEIWGRH